MGFSQDSAVAAARRDLASRLGVDESTIDEVSVVKTDFPDMSLGAPVDGEMSAQMIATGWRIDLAADGQNYEYRADKYQLRLRNFKGRNYVINS
ncbi:MAG: hypothetical protein ACK4S4_07585 [Pyrinomonadaceae bacterium]